MFLFVLKQFTYQLIIFFKTKQKYFWLKSNFTFLLTVNLFFSFSSYIFSAVLTPVNGCVFDKTYKKLTYNKLNFTNINNNPNLHASLQNNKYKQKKLSKFTHSRKYNLKLKII